MPDDNRFTFGLIHDIAQVLQDHGYRCPAPQEGGDRARGRALLALADLCRAFEGTDTHTGGAQ